MGSWHTAVSPCHCDNPLYCGLLFLKRKKNFKSRFTKRVVTPQPERSFSFDMEALELEEEDDEAKEQSEDGSSLDEKGQLFFDQKWRLGLRLMFFGLI
jgi:hypothetical protein